MAEPTLPLTVIDFDGYHFLVVPADPKAPYFANCQTREAADAIARVFNAPAPLRDPLREALIRDEISKVRGYPQGDHNGDWTPDPFGAFVRFPDVRALLRRLTVSDPTWAGRALVAALDETFRSHRGTAAWRQGMAAAQASVEDALPVIEAEAVAAFRRDLVEQVRALPGDCGHIEGPCGFRADVLALLDPRP